MNPIHSLRLAAALALLLPLPQANAQAYGLTERPDVDAFFDGTFPEVAPSIPAEWSTVVAFPNLSFVNPLGLASIPEDRIAETNDRLRTARGRRAAGQLQGEPQ